MLSNPMRMFPLPNKKKIKIKLWVFSPFSIWPQSMTTALLHSCKGAGYQPASTKGQMRKKPFGRMWRNRLLIHFSHCFLGHVSHSPAWPKFLPVAQQSLGLLCLEQPKFPSCCALVVVNAEPIVVLLNILSVGFNNNFPLIHGSFQ